MLKKLFILLTAIIFLKPNPSSCQKPYSFKQITTNEGLSQSNVLCILKDSKGFMWFGTQDGLNRYDGYNFTVYRNDPKDTNSISNNYILCLYEDKKGDLWIGTLAGGLNIFDRSQNLFVHHTHNEKVKNSLSNNQVRAIYEDKKGNIWIGTSGGLNLYDKKKKTFRQYVPDKNDKGSYEIYSLYEDKKGDFWIGTFSSGLYKFDRDRGDFKHYPYNKIYKAKCNNKTLSSSKVLCILEAEDGKIWLGLDEMGGMELFDPTTETFTHYKHNEGNRNSLSVDDVTGLVKDKKGYLWVGTRNFGIDIFDVRNNSFFHCKSDRYNTKSLSNNSIHSMYMDNEGDMWIGTYSGGINYFSSRYKKFELYKHEVKNTNESSINVLSVLEDKKGNLWIGTDGGGLNRYNRKTGQYLNYKKGSSSNGINDDVILSLAEDHEGNIWIGTLTNGLTMLNPGTGRFVYYDDIQTGSQRGPGYSTITAIIEDQKNNLWLGSWGGGVSYFNRQTGLFKHYSFDPNDKKSLNDNVVFSLYKDRGNNIWVGTAAGGLNKFDSLTQSFIYYKNDVKNPKSISNNLVNAIYEDKKGNLWIGTNAGLNLFDKTSKSFIVFRQKDGLPGDVIQCIEEDNKGNLWLSTNKGISKFNPRTKTFKNYDVTDGLQGNDFKRRASFYSKTTGVMYFGGPNGLSTFYPDSINDNPLIPQVAITDFQIFNNTIVPGVEGSVLTTDISETKEIKLSYKDQVFSFGFAAMSYISPEKNQYAYKMEGFDKEWNYVGTQRRATYTNLDPGEYIFRVNASNNDGIWNENGVAIKLVITPPFWETFWFRILVALFIIASVIGFFYIRFANIRRKNKLLHRMVQDRTQKIEEKNRQIEMQRDNLVNIIKVAEESNEVKSRFFSSISHEFRTSLSLIYLPIKQILESLQDMNLKPKIETIYYNANRLLKLSNELLDFEKIDKLKYKLNFNKERLDLHLIQLHKSFIQVAEDKHIELILDCPEGLIAEYDKEVFDKVLVNLISNALAFTNKNGTIQILIELIDEQVHISVSDTGIGIDQESVAFIFDRFYQAKNDALRSQKGSGIGLALCKELIQLHGGTINVSSTINKGTTFEIIFSQIHVNQFESVNAGFESTKVEFVKEQFMPKTSNNTILIVEDNTDLLNVLCELVGKYYKVSTAVNGKEALGKIQQNMPDLVLSDILMPEMDGFELCSEIKKNASTFHIPVVLLTALESQDVSIQGFNSGADAYQTKPFNESVLLSRIDNLLSSRERFKKYYPNSFFSSDFLRSKENSSIEFIEKCKKIIIDNSDDEDFNMNTFAEAMNMSPSTLYRRMKEIVGMKVVDFIKKIKMEYAAQLLLYSNLPVNEVSWKVGYGDPKYFSKCFQAEFKLTPTKFRRNI